MKVQPKVKIDSQVKKRRNRQIVAVLFAYLVVYLVLEYLYPFPNGISDSANYVLSSSRNSYLGYRPFGYSHFLILIHSLTQSIHFVVFVQYWLNAFCSSLLIFTILYLFPPKNKWIEFLFIFFSFFSIVQLYITNCLLSDTLFTSLTMLWVTSLLLAVQKDNKHKLIFIFIHLVLLCVLFYIRYTAMFYVLITIPVIYLSLKNKVLAIGMMVLSVGLISLIYSKQTQVSQRITWVNSHSGFEGWQMANNALHVLPHVRLDTTIFNDQEVRTFALWCTTFNDSLMQTPKYNTTAKFMWDQNLPLKQYLSLYLKTSGTFLKTFTWLGEKVYKPFAVKLIMKYPGSYFRYWVLPNFCGIVYPTWDDVIKQYNNGYISKTLLKSWFGIEELRSRSNVLKYVSPMLPAYRAIIWLLFLGSVIYSAITWKKTERNYWLLVTFVVVYFLFHLFSATFYIRFIPPIHIVQMTVIFFPFLGKPTLS